MLERFFATSLLLLLLLSTVHSLKQDYRNVPAVQVFKHGEDGVPCYRIPALLQTAKGTLIAFANARNWTGDSCFPKNFTRDCTVEHCEVWVTSRRSNDGGTNWGPIVRHELGVLGTVVYDRTTGTVIAQFCRGLRNCLQSRTTYQIISRDDGITYSSPLHIDLFLAPFSGVHPCCGQALQLSSGRIVFCAVHGLSPNSNVTVYFSDNGGLTYETSMDAGYRFSKMGECTMAELQNGSIYMNMRPHEDPEKCDCRAYSLSHDNGATWNGPFFDHHLIHGPGCQASVLGSNGNTVYFSNPFTRDDSRNNMTVQISHDGATTWTSQFQVNTGPAAYSSLSAIQDGDPGLLYETNATGCDGPACGIVFSRIPMKF